MKKAFIVVGVLAALSGAGIAASAGMGWIEFRNVALSSNPCRAGHACVYPNADGTLHTVTATGTDTVIGSGGGGMGGAGGGGVVVAPTFRSIFPLSDGSTYTAPAGGAVFALPMWMPSGTTSVTVRVQNITPSAGSYADVAGVNLAIGTSDGSANFLGSPTVYSSITVGGAYQYVSPPTAITRGTDGYALISISVPASTTVGASSVIAMTGQLNTGTTTVYPLSGSATTITTLPYTIQVEYATTAPRLVVIGDSIPEAYHYHYDVPGTGRSAWMAMGPDHGYAVYNFSESAVRMYNRLDRGLAETFFTTSDFASVIRGAIVDVELGVNDLPYAQVLGGTNLYQSYDIMVHDLVQLLRAYGAKAIVFETLSPCAAYEGANGAARVTYNRWMLTKPFGIDAVIDRSSALSTSGTATTTPDTLKSIYDTPALDGCHPNDAGQAVQESLIYSSVSAL